MANPTLRQSAGIADSLPGTPDFDVLTLTSSRLGVGEPLPSSKNSVRWCCRARWGGAGAFGPSWADRNPAYAGLNALGGSRCRDLWIGGRR